MKRREFVERSFSVAGLLTAGGINTAFPAVPIPSQPVVASEREPNPALEGGGFRLGMVTYNLGKDWDIPTIIKNCEQTGFEAVELRTSHKHGVEPSLTKDQRLEVHNRFTDTSVRLLSLGSTCEFHSPDAAIVRKNIDETRRFVELAHDIGALGVKVRPNGIPKDVPEEKTLEQIGKALRECGEHAMGYGVEIWVEVHGRDSCIPGRMRRMMEVADHPMVGICWNSNPEDVENRSVQRGFDLLKFWLRNAHINELWNREYPWKELFNLMKQTGYNRYTLAEIPESSDPVRLMHYYRALWLELVG